MVVPAAPTSACVFSAIQDEYRAFLKRHNVPIDERYVWVNRRIAVSRPQRANR
jgi:hypothetical protein